MSWHVAPTWKTTKDGATAEWKSGPYSMRLEMTFKKTDTARSLNWQYHFTNGSGAALTDVASFNCFNLVDAPSFIDLEMKRTRVSNKDGKSVCLCDVKKTIGKRTMQFYPARGSLNLAEFERFSRYGVTSTQALDGDRISVTSRNGKWTVQCIVEGRVAYFFNNWESDHGCIHAAPWLGNVEAGKSATAKGSIVFARRKST